MPSLDAFIEPSAQVSGLLMCTTLTCQVGVMRSRAYGLSRCMSLGLTDSLDDAGGLLGSINDKAIYGYSYFRCLHYLGVHSIPLGGRLST